jgi:hypothetical protein
MTYLLFFRSPLRVSTYRARPTHILCWNSISSFTFHPSLDRIQLSRFRGMRNTPQLAAYVFGDFAP